MRLCFLEVSGFRGFQGKVRIEFGAGFTVITGRNGVGKSTLCDAIEFVLTGSISKYKVASAAMEHVDDYLWWRGDGIAKECYVSVGFVRDSGEQFVVTRTRDAGLDCSPEELEERLCSGPRPSEAIRQLCKTAIIRDEWIAALSVDLSEVERFKLVRSALGPQEGSDLEKKAKDVVKCAKAGYEEHEVAYERARFEVSQYMAQLSETRDAIARAEDIETAMREVSEAVADAPSSIIELIAAGRGALATGRSWLVRVKEVMLEGREVATQRGALDTLEAKERKRGARIARDRAANARTEAAKVLAAAESEFAGEKKTDAMAASLALVVEHGSRLGIHDGHCPLCGATRTAQEFEAGLEVARGRIRTAASHAAVVHRGLEKAREDAERAGLDYVTANAGWSAIRDEETSVEVKETRHIEALRELGLEIHSLQELENLEDKIADRRERLLDLERALATLEASQIASRAAALEDRVRELREDAEVAAKRMERSQRAWVAASAVERAVTRVNAEIVEERLAQIRPLLNELYQRLRPHSDWRTIDYSIRGDVRRFLSLRVGRQLNPQFVLSSGQRRAVGLAFLLAVHLSCTWTTWRSVVLDDPVQHIDDFRALQFVEILGAFRFSDRQIVCTVEDQALAQLLCRRLATNEVGVGRRYDIEFDSGNGAAVVAEVPIQLMAPDVLRRVAAG